MAENQVQAVSTDGFLVVFIIFVAKHYGPCTAENCRKIELSTSVIASQ